MEIRNKLMFLFILVLIPMASSVEVYSGDSYSFETEEFEYYTVAGNSSDMVGMDVSWENGNTTISFNIRYEPDNFTIVLFNEKEVPVEKIVYRGGGGGGSTRTEYVDKIIIQPRFYDRNITEIVEKEIINEKIIYEEQNPIWFYVSLFVIGLCMVIAILYLRATSNEKQTEYP